MKVFLLKDIKNIGMAAEIVDVSEGYAKNFLIPGKSAVQITAKNEALYAQKKLELANRKDVIVSKTSMIAEKIKTITLNLRKKTHDDGKLYGSVSASEISDLLLEKEGISISKSQVIFDKVIKEKGIFEVTIKLTTKIQPKIKVKIVG